MKSTRQTLTAGTSGCQWMLLYGFCRPSGRKMKDDMGRVTDKVTAPVERLAVILSILPSFAFFYLSITHLTSGPENAREGRMQGKSFYDRFCQCLTWCFRSCRNKKYPGHHSSCLIDSAVTFHFFHSFYIFQLAGIEGGKKKSTHVLECNQNVWHLL